MCCRRPFSVWPSMSIISSPVVPVCLVCRTIRPLFLLLHNSPPPPPNLGSFARAPSPLRQVKRGCYCRFCSALAICRSCMCMCVSQCVHALPRRHCGTPVSVKLAPLWLRASLVPGSLFSRLFLLSPSQGLQKQACCFCTDPFGYGTTTTATLVPPTSRIAKPKNFVAFAPRLSLLTRLPS